MPDVALPLESTIREDFGAETPALLGFCSTNYAPVRIRGDRFRRTLRNRAVAPADAAARATLRLAPKLIAPGLHVLSGPVPGPSVPPALTAQPARHDTPPLDDPRVERPERCLVFRLADTAASPLPAHVAGIRRWGETPSRSRPRARKWRCKKQGARGRAEPMSTPADLVELTRATAANALHGGHSGHHRRHRAPSSRPGEMSLSPFIYPRPSAQCPHPGLPPLRGGPPRSAPTRRCARRPPSRCRRGTITDLAADWLAAMDPPPRRRSGPRGAPRPRLPATPLIRRPWRPRNGYTTNCPRASHTGFLQLGPPSRAPARDLLRPRRIPYSARCAPAEDLCGRTSPGYGIDGCSAPNFAVSLRRSPPAHGRSHGLGQTKRGGDARAPSAAIREA